MVDCANGAASEVGPTAYAEAGAEVIAIHADPDGLNINDDCGSTHLEAVREAVLEHGADLGIAHDGDADRCLAVTAAGDVVDGDQIMAILALAMRDAGTLTDDTLVATVMSNLGLRLAMKQAGIRLIETKVGDRYVLEELQAGGLALGGEQSGHIVMPAFATTGDGVLTGLHLMAQLAATGKSLADLAAVMHKLPQVLINVRVGDRAGRRGGADGAGRGGAGRERAGRDRPGAAAPVRHRAAGPGDGRGRRPRSRPARSPSGSPTRCAPPARPDRPASAPVRAWLRFAPVSIWCLLGSGGCPCRGLARRRAWRLASGQARVRRRAAASSMTDSRLQKANRIRCRPASWWS